MSTMILALFQDRDLAEHTINELEARGYNPKEMSLIMKSKVDAEYLAHETGADVAGGAVSGATTGGIIGGIAGLLVGVGAIAIPGIGAILIGGPLAALLGLTGAAATTASGALTGALAGGLIGALVGLGVPKEEAHAYEEGIKQGGILLAVPARVGDEQEVYNVLEEHDATNIHTIKDQPARKMADSKLSDEYDEDTVVYADTEADSYTRPMYASKTTKKRTSKP